MNRCPRTCGHRSGGQGMAGAGSAASKRRSGRGRRGGGGVAGRRGAWAGAGAAVWGKRVLGLADGPKEQDVPAVPAEQPGRPDVPSDPLGPDKAEGVCVFQEVDGEARRVAAGAPPPAQLQVERFQDLLDRDVGWAAADVARDAVHAADLMLKSLARQMSV